MPLEERGEGWSVGGALGSRADESGDREEVRGVSARLTPSAKSRSIDSEALQVCDDPSAKSLSEADLAVGSGNLSPNPKSAVRRPCENLSGGIVDGMDLANSFRKLEGQLSIRMSRVHGLGLGKSNSPSFVVAVLTSGDHGKSRRDYQTPVARIRKKFQRLARGRRGTRKDELSIPAPDCPVAF